MYRNKKNILNKIYKIKLKKLMASSTVSLDAGLILFVEHLKYLRSYLALKNTIDVEYEAIKTDVMILSTAIAEFDAYKNAKEKTQKIFHWNNFCDFIKLNMGEWLLLNDSI